MRFTVLVFLSTCFGNVIIHKLLAHFIIVLFSNVDVVRPAFTKTLSQHYLDRLQQKILLGYSDFPLTNGRDNR